MSVTAANHGINGKDCLVLKQTDVTVTSGGDALRAEGYDVDSLAIVESMNPETGEITFRH